MNGRMDLAVLYGDKADPRPDVPAAAARSRCSWSGRPRCRRRAEPCRCADLREIELFLPRPYNVVRKLVDEAFARAGMVPRVVAEIESAFTLTAAIADGLGATILPASMAREVVAVLRRLAVPHRRSGDRGAAGAVPVGPPAAVRAGAGGEGHPARAGRRPARQPSTATPEPRAQRRHKPPLSRHSQSVLGFAAVRRYLSCLPHVFAECVGPSSGETRMDQEQIKTLIDALAASDLAELEFSQDGCTLRLVRQQAALRARRRGVRRAAPAAADGRAMPRRPTHAPASADADRVPGAAVRRRPSAAVARRAALRAGRPGGQGRPDAVRDRGDEGLQRGARRARRARCRRCWCAPAQEVEAGQPLFRFG